MSEHVWAEKYRPKSISDCILPNPLKKRFLAYGTMESIPNLLFLGPPGTGKTTVAKALVEDLNADSIFINASLDRNIDVLRTDITNFATALSLEGKRKFVILDEADYLNASSTQPALRNFIDQFSDNCGFIFTCNYPKRILDALRSRCDEIVFDYGKDQFLALGAHFLKRLIFILDMEKIPYDSAVLAALLKANFPDFRKIINTLQGYAKAHGIIDNGILARSQSAETKQLIKWLKSKNFDAICEWTLSYAGLDTINVMREIFSHRTDIVEPKHIPDLIVLIGKYQYQDNFAADKAINLLALFADVMTRIPLKYE